MELLGVAFDGTGIEQGTPQPLVPPGGTLTFDEAVIPEVGPPHPRFTGAVDLHWRARVATNNPLFPHTAWFSLPGNNVTETKLRRPGRVSLSPP